MSDKIFEVIYADPPWRYSNLAPRKGDRIDSKYKTMPTSKIENYLKDENIQIAEKAVCYLWTTNPLLIDALKVLYAWGFKYKTNLAWDKQIIGLGYWLRGQHELLLIGNRGNSPPPPGTQRISSVFSQKRARHSEKPGYIRGYLTKTYFNQEKIELFYRKPTPKQTDLNKIGEISWDNLSKKELLSMKWTFMGKET